jgi:hypothetical protein
MNIRKNDIVSNTKPFTTYNTTVPVGTRFRVYKAKRDGTLYASNIDAKSYSSTTMLHANDVIKLDAPKPSIQIGDIFVCSWGYGQNNVTYYQVVQVLPKSVVVREIDSTHIYQGPMHGQCMPVANQFKGKERTVRIRIDGHGLSSFRAYSFACAYPWDGKPGNFSEWH